MKKQIIIMLSTLLLNSLAGAEPTLYGSIGYDLSYHAPKTSPHRSPHSTQSSRQLNSRDSYIGIKGREDLGNGNELIYKLEWGLDQRDTRPLKNHSLRSHRTKEREAYLGITGDWGTLLIGRIDNPFKATIQGGSVSDQFYLNQ